MDIYKILIISFLSIAFVACNGAHSSTKKKFSLEILDSKKEFQINDTFNINIINKKNIEIDSIKYELSREFINVKNNTVSLEIAKLEKQEITATIYHDGKIEKNSTSITILSDKAPVVYTYKVINEYPHDQKAFTQGLEFHNDTLYESTGKKGESSLRKVDYKTGKVLQQVNLNAA